MASNRRRIERLEAAQLAQMEQAWEEFVAALTDIFVWMRVSAAPEHIEVMNVGAADWPAVMAAVDAEHEAGRIPPQLEERFTRAGANVDVCRAISPRAWAEFESRRSTRLGGQP